MSASVSDTYGSAHLPECFIEPNPLMRECRVCEALRACEQRVRMESTNYRCALREERGYADALELLETEIVAAIRSLREKP